MFNILQTAGHLVKTGTLKQKITTEKKTYFNTVENISLLLQSRKGGYSIENSNSVEYVVYCGCDYQINNGDYLIIENVQYEISAVAKKDYNLQITPFYQLIVEKK